MNRRELVREISRRLSGRRLVWAGVRGDDAEPLTDIPEFDSSFTIIGSYEHRSSITSLAYEDLSGRRVDLETWDIDEHPDDEATQTFRRALLRRLAAPTALLTYRPSRFLSAIWFARRETCSSLGMFGGHQQAFEHKPWVETELTAAGVPTIPWTYVADEDQLRATPMMADGPIILRRSRTSGGEGIVRVDTQEELSEQWLASEERFVSVAPFLAGGIPVNIGGTVWADGVTVHYPSVQLIGIPELGRRTFGYCGNDFGAVRSLGPEIVNQLEVETRAVGRWLATKGYRGTFGIDFLIQEGRPLFTEVNPRFQGSTHLSSRISAERGEACLMLEHIAALLGVAAPTQPPLRSRVTELPSLSNVVIHSLFTEPQRIDPPEPVRQLARDPRVVSSDVATREEILTDPGAVVLRFTAAESVTETGFELRAPWRSLLEASGLTAHAGAVRTT